MSRYASASRIVLSVCVLASLNGCGWLPEDRRPQNHAMRPPFDMRAMLGMTEAAQGPVTVYDAIALGLENNLGHRTSSMEKGEIIPASYSPGTTPWSTLDNGIGYARNKSSGPYDYQRKAAAEIVQDVRYAWTRAASAALLKNDLESTITSAKAYLTRTPDASIEKQLNTLVSLQQELNSAPAQLAALTSTPGARLETKSLDAIEKAPVAPIKTSVEELEIAALLTRPEIRDALAREPMRVEEIREAVLQKFPNIRTLLRQASAPKKTFSQTDWENFSTTFTQSLIRIFTLPLQLENDQNRHLLASLRQQALSAAILAQVHLAYSQYNDAHQKFSSYRALLDRTNAMPLMTDETAALRLSVTRVTARARLHLAQAELQTATARLMEAVGLDLLPGDLKGLTPQMIAEDVKKRLKTADYALIDTLVARIDQHKSPMAPVANHAILAAGTLAKPEIKAGIEPALYRQDQGVSMWQASISGPALAVPSLRIPPAEKMSAKTLPPGAVPVATGETETLRMPDRQTRALLEAPISNDP